MLDQSSHSIHVLPVQITQVFTSVQRSLLPEDFHTRNIGSYRKFTANLHFVSI